VTTAALVYVLLSGGVALALSGVQCAPQRLTVGAEDRVFDIVAVFPDSPGPTSVDVVTSSPGLRVVGAPSPVSNETADGFASSWNTLITFSLASGAADGDYVITVRGIGADETACTIDLTVDTAVAEGPIVLLPDESGALGEPGTGQEAVVTPAGTDEAAAPSGNLVDQLLDRLPSAGRFFVFFIGFVVVGGIILSLGALAISIVRRESPQDLAAPEVPVVEVASVKRRRSEEVDLDDLAAGTTRRASPLPAEEPTPLFGPRRRSERNRAQRRAAAEVSVAPLAVPDEAPPRHDAGVRRTPPPRRTAIQRFRTSGVGRAYLMRKARAKVKRPSVIRRMRTAIARERAAATAPKWDPSTRPSLPAPPPEETSDFVPHSVENAG
jgi:hypothetical protein